jgi:hypothetical protein
LSSGGRGIRTNRLVDVALVDDDDDDSTPPSRAGGRGEGG